MFSRARMYMSFLFVLSCANIFFFRFGFVAKVKGEFHLPTKSSFSSCTDFNLFFSETPQKLAVPLVQGAVNFHKTPNVKMWPCTTNKSKKTTLADCILIGSPHEFRTNWASAVCVSADQPTNWMCLTLYCPMQSSDRGCRLTIGHTAVFHDAKSANQNCSKGEKKVRCTFVCHTKTLWRNNGKLFLVLRFVLWS